MGTIQVRVDDGLKTATDSLFASLGLDTSTAVRIFLVAALEHNGIPFAVKHNNQKHPNAELREAVQDVRKSTDGIAKSPDGCHNREIVDKM